MKKLLSIALSLILMSSFTAFASDLGLVLPEEPLMEKLKKQVIDGSGFSAVLSFEMNGDTLFSSWVGGGMNNAVTKLSYILTDMLSGNWQSTVQVMENDEEIYQATINSKASDLFVLESGTEIPFSFTKDNLLSALLPGGRDEEAPWESMLIQLLTMEDNTWNNNMTTALQPYLIKLELWLADYADYEMSLNQGVITIDYIIPVSDVLTMTELLLSELLADEAFMVLLNEVFLDEMLSGYFNSMSMEYYQLVFMNTDVEGNVIINQSISTKGENGITTITLPLTDNPYGVSALTLANNGKQTVITAMIPSGSLSVTIKTDETPGLHGSVLYTPADDDSFTVTDDEPAAAPAPFSASFSWMQTNEGWTDDNNRRHTLDNYELVVSPDFSHISASTEEEFKALASRYVEFPPYRITFSLHLHSGMAKTSSTTLIAELTQTQQDAKFTARFEGKTTAPWLSRPTSFDDAVRLTGESLSTRLLSAVMTILTHFTPAMLLTSAL